MQNSGTPVCHEVTEGGFYPEAELRGINIPIISVNIGVPAYVCIRGVIRERSNKEILRLLESVEHSAWIILEIGVVQKD